MGTATGIIRALNSGIKHIAMKRFTLRYPEEKLKFVGDGYQFDPSTGVGIAGLKGRHMLFHDHCTGCQLCSIACEGVAEAIAMVKVPEEHKQNKKSIMPQIERIPFDLPEAESEIVAGWLTELSGMMYGLVQLGTYLKLYAFAGLFVVLFLGGWNGPMVVPPFPEELLTGIEMGPITVGPFPGLPLFDQEMLNGTLWFVLKTAGVIFFILLPRGVFPRIRVDMLLNLGWTKLIGLAFVNIFIALGLLYAGVLGPGGLQ